MATSTLRLKAGVSEVSTPTLNEAIASQSQLIRFFSDPTYGNLTQKLGGWARLFPNAMPAIPRALWAWEDTNGMAHLAIGTENIGTSGQANLSVLTNGQLANITPRSATDNITPAASATTGSPIITITDTTTENLTQYDSVYIQTHISIGGIVLFGLYPIELFSPTKYQIIALDALGNPLPATATSTTTMVEEFTTTAALSVVTVTLDNHGYVVGNTYPCLIPTTVGSITIYGNYIVASVVDANNFTINASNVAASSATGFINGGDARYVYSFGIGAIPGGTGYGILGYGRGGYGSGAGITPSTGTPITADDWTLDNWGQILIACPDNGTLFQPVYQYDPTSGSPIATAIPQAPTLNDGIFVAMPQRQIVAWGSSETGIQDPLLIRWCDTGNFNSWIGTVTNQAGSYRIPKGSRIVGCIQGPQQGLIWTDIDLWSMQYIGGTTAGAELVYSFNEIGTGCGLIARKAAASLNGVVYWMGASQFFYLGEYGVTPIPCSVWDTVYQNLDKANLQKIRVAVNALFQEITWYYPSANGGGEVDSYVKLNTLLNCWDYGSLGRSAWIDQSVLGPPIGADPASLYIYQHEVSPDADGQPLLASFRTSYFAMSDGDVMTFVDQVWPDMKWGTYSGTPNATVNITFYVANYPGQTPNVFGPYPVTQATNFLSPRFRGRLVAIQIDSSDIGSFWRMGALRYRFSGGGKY